MQVDDRMKFILSAAAGAVGVLVTLVFIPEITSLDLKEGDARWDLMKKGIIQDRHLSMPVSHTHPSVRISEC